MLLLGFLLAAAVAAFTGLAIADNTGGSTIGVSMVGNHLANLTPLQIFLCGLALALIFCLGLAMLASGLHAHRRRRLELRSARREAKQAARERDALAARTADDTTAAPGGGDGRYAGSRTDTAAGASAGGTAMGRPARRHRTHHLFGH